MRTITAACTELVDRFRVAGYRAHLDPEQLVTDPTVIWVQPRSITDVTLDGGATLLAWCHLICANVETTQALRLLDDLLEGVLELVDLADTDTAIDLASAIVLPTNPSNTLPAFRVAVDLEL